MDTVISQINIYFQKSRLTKKEFAQKVNVSEITIRKILNGEQSIKVSTLQKISEILDVDICAFFSVKERDDLEVIKLKDEIKDLKKQMKKDENHINLLIDHIEILKSYKKKENE